MRRLLLGILGLALSAQLAFGQQKTGYSPNVNYIAPTASCADGSDRIATTKYVDTCAGSGNATLAGPNAFTGLNDYTGSAPQFYVNASTGSDANDCLAASSGGGNGPCLTFAHTVVVMYGYDINGTVAQIHLAAGSYSGGSFFSGQARGTARPTLPAAAVYITGAGSGSTTLDDASANCGTIITTNGATVVLTNIYITKSTGCGGLGSDVFAQDLSYVAIGGDVKFGTAGGQFLHAEGNSVIEDTAGFTIAGNASAAIGLSHGGRFLEDGHTITCTGSPTFNETLLIQSSAAAVFLTSSAWSGCGSVTGARYVVQNNGILDYVAASTSDSFIPGSSPGLNYASEATGLVQIRILIDFSVAGDVAIPITVPPRYTRWRAGTIYLSGASANISAATYGLFTGAGGTGTTLIAAGQTISITSAAEDTNNNMQNLTALNNINSQSHNQTTIYFRVGATASGTAYLTFNVQGMS